MTIKLLDWQKDCVEKFSGDFAKEKNFVIYAGTGSGKTIAASQCIYDHLLSHPSDLVIVSVPYRAIKNSWADALRLHGLEVATKEDDVNIYTNIVITTYSGARFHLRYISDEMPKRKLLLVFDEFHHLEETNSWASVFIDMEENRVNRRILLSGTPWRESGKIPESWVRYDEQEEVIAHVKHTYGQNVNGDDSQRNTVPVKFKPMRVTGVERCRPNGGGDHYDEPFDSNNTTMDDSMAPFVRFLSAEEFSEQQGSVDMLESAIEKLNVLRLTNPLAGGIAFAGNQQAARALHEILEQQYGKRVVTVSSDEPQSHKRIKEFRDNPLFEWIITVDMVSEGVDIPRLRVVVDFSNRKTLLHIIQRWGRVLRRMRDRNGIAMKNDCDAYIFFVGHAKLRYVAEKIEEDIHRNRKKSNGGGAEGLPPPAVERETLTQNGDWLSGVFKGMPLEDQIERVADWIWQTDFNDVRSDRLGLAGAINVARLLIKKNDVPEEFMASGDDFISPDEPFTEECETYKPPLDKIVEDYTKISNRIIQGAFKHDPSAAMKEINIEHGVKSWDRKHKSRRELEQRYEACQRVHVRLFGERYGNCR